MFLKPADWSKPLVQSDTDEREVENDRGIVMWTTDWNDRGGSHIMH